MREELTPILLQRLAAEILENAAFIFCEPTEDPPPHFEPVLVAEIGFESETGRGSMAVAASPAFCAMLAANLLGLDPNEPTSQEQQEGALGELANMLVGALCEKLLGSEVVCGIGLPRLSQLPPEEHAGKLASSICSCSLQADFTHRIDLLASLEPGGARP